jgi:lysine-specific demethylase 8
MTERSLPEFPSGSAEFHRQIRRRRPAIVRGLARDWSAVSKWTAGWLADHFGDRPLPAVAVRNGMIVYDAKRGWAQRPLTYAEFWKEKGGDSEPRLYLSLMLNRDCPELLEDVDVPDWFRKASYQAFRLWTGPAGISVPIHFDLNHNLLVQISGRKRLRLFAPSQWINLYPNAPWSSLPAYSQVNPVAPDTNRFPRYNRCTRWEGEIGPGDVAFIPRFWWHDVTGLTTNMSLTCWWSNGLLSLAPRLAIAYRRWRSVRD